MDDISIYAGLGSVPIVVGLTQVIKQLLDLPDEWAKRLMPVVSIGFGVGVNYLVASQIDPKPGLAVVVAFGVMAGLAASGLFSGTKAVAGK